MVKKTEDRGVEDERREGESCLEALLLEGLQGEETEMTRADWRHIRREAFEQLTARRRNSCGP